MSTATADIEAQPRRIYRDYSLEFKAEALALYKANNNNALRTANELGIDESVLRKWIAREDHYRTESERKQADLAGQFEQDANTYLALARSKAEDASFSQLMTGAAISVDKMLVLRGQPTSITLNVDRQEVTVTLQAALNEVIDVTPHDQRS